MVPPLLVGGSSTKGRRPTQGLTMALAILGKPAVQQRGIPDCIVEDSIVARKTRRSQVRILPLLLKKRMVHRAMRFFYVPGIAGLETITSRTAAEGEERDDGAERRAGGEQ